MANKINILSKYKKDDRIQIRVINTRTNKSISLADYDDLWEYRYYLDIQRDGIQKKKLKKLQELIVKYAQKYIQLQIKSNSHYISYIEALNKS